MERESRREKGFAGSFRWRRAYRGCALWFGITAAFFLFLVPANGFEAVKIVDYEVFDGTSGAPLVKRPDGVAILEDGSLVLMDRAKDRVVIRRPDGRRIRIACKPRAIAAWKMKIVVAEDERILRFTEEGKLERVVADGDRVPFGSIRGLGFDDVGNLYVADAGRDLVFVISPDGTPMGTIGREEPEIAKLKNPTDVAVDRFGNIFILDAGHDRVAVYRRNRFFKREIGPFRRPVGLAVDRYGLVYLAEAGENRIQRFTATGAGKGMFGNKGRARGQFRGLSGIAVGPEGRIAVVDRKNRSFHLLDWPPGEISEQIVQPAVSVYKEKTVPEKARVLGGGKGLLVLADKKTVVLRQAATGRDVLRINDPEMKNPVAAAVSPEGKIYVVDRSAGVVRAYDRAGRKLFDFGKGNRILFFRGGTGKLKSPVGIAISSKGVIAIADVDKVELFGPDGAFLGRVGPEDDEAPGAIVRPVGIHFEPNGYLAVADRKFERVGIYNASGNYTEQLRAFLRPIGMTGDEEGRLYVLDEEGPQVIFLNANVNQIGALGVGRWRMKELRKANGLAIVGDRLFVSAQAGLSSFRLDLPLAPPETATVEARARSAAICWTRPTRMPFYGYRIEGKEIALTVAAESAVVKGLKEETEYAVRIRTLNSFGRPGPAGPEIVFRTAPLDLSPPRKLKTRLSKNGREIEITWEPSGRTYVAEYLIEGSSDGREYHEVARSAVGPVRLPLGTDIFFRIRSVSDDGKVGAASEAVENKAAAGRVAMISGDYPTASLKLYQATRENPRSLFAWRWLGEVSERLERFAEAERAYEKVRELDSGETMALLGLARLAVVREDWDKAEELVEDLKASAADDPEYFYLSGMTALARHRYDTAVALLTEAVARAPISRNREALEDARRKREEYGRNRPRVEILSARLQPIFPALYKKNMSDTIGTVTIRNTGDQTLHRVRVSLFIREAMDFPSDALIEELKPGETTVRALSIVLANEVLENTEDDTKQAEMRVTYYRSGEPVSIRRSFAVRLYARNAIVWSDPRRVASFVTVRDPAVAAFARGALANAAKLPEVLEYPLRAVLVLREELAAAGLSYLPDPVTPYAVVSESERVDHVQLPRETLRNRSGDCDDLVVLMAALLENIGVRTAVVDLPQHLLLLVDSELPPQAAARLGLSEKCYEYEGTLWIPIEATLTRAPLEKAIEEGARRLRESGEQARILPLDRAWEDYPPVTTPSEAWRPEVPPLPAGTRGEWESLRWKRVNALLRAMERKVGEPGYANRVGLIYADAQLWKEAKEWFRKAPEDAAAWNNLGNIAAIEERWEEALKDYEKAAALDPEDAGIRRNIEHARKMLEEAK